jgi:hypothetical protein
MKTLLRVTMLTLVFCTSFLPLSTTDASEGLLGRFHKQNQGPTTTTPTRAFLLRQSDAMKRGIANIPGVRNVMANHRAKHP